LVNSASAPTKAIALRLALLRSARVVLGGALAACVLAVLAYFDGLAANVVPADFTGDSLFTTLLVLSGASVVGGIAKYLRELGIMPQAPV